MDLLSSSELESGQIITTAEELEDAQVLEELMPLISDKSEQL